MTPKPPRRRRLAALAPVGLAALVVGGAAYFSRKGRTSRGWPGHAEVVSLPSPVGLRPPWNGRAFINDNLWTRGDLQFAVWVDPAGRPIVGRRNGGGSWQTADLAALPGNPLGAPTGIDEHNVYAIGLDRQGFVHVAGNTHGPAALRRFDPPARGRSTGDGRDGGLAGGPRVVSGLRAVAHR